MKFIISKIAKEILAEQEQIKIFKEAYEIELQKRLNIAFEKETNK